jgi:hypothetical protein
MPATVFWRQPHHNEGGPHDCILHSRSAVAQQNLRSVLCFCNSPLMNTLEAYVQFKPGLIAEDGTVTNDSTAEFLRAALPGPHALRSLLQVDGPRQPQLGSVSRDCAGPGRRHRRGRASDVWRPLPCLRHR